MASDLKAVLIHTAEPQSGLGPSYQFGWGVINLLKAGRAIAGRDGVWMDSKHVTQGDVIAHVLRPAGAAIRATLVWTDEPGTPNSGGVDDASPTLINDLDLELVAPDGTIHYPYSFDPERLGHVVQDRRNTADNVEVIDAGAISGEWILRIRATRTSRAGQSYSLCVSGAKLVR
jgi:hypothetical protein